MRLTKTKHVAIVVLAGVLTGVGCWNAYLLWADYNSRSKVQYFLIELEPNFEGALRLVEDSTMPIDFSRRYTLVQDGDTLPVPAGFDSSTPYQINGIFDKTGATLSPGHILLMGEFGMIGDFTGWHPDYEIAGHYWVFGTVGED